MNKNPGQCTKSFEAKGERKRPNIATIQSHTQTNTHMRTLPPLTCTGAYEDLNMPQEIHHTQRTAH